MLRNLLESCTPDDARIIMECLAILHPEQTAGLTPAGGRQVELISLVEQGYDTSPKLQKITGMTGNNVSTQLKRLEVAGYIIADRTYQKHTRYRRVTVEDMLKEGEDNG
jgi:predicted Rossmann fold nucleotide-binding protein DprA/Smf involved in DNA uptake